MRISRLFLLIAVSAGFGLAQTPDYTLHPDNASDLDIAPVLERADADNDRWIGEQDYEALNAKLKAISKKMHDDPRAFAPLAEQAARFAKLELAELKIVGSRRNAEGRPHLRVRVELGGEDTKGNRLGLLGSMELDWAPAEGGDWQVADSKIGAFTESHAGAIRFTDITQTAVGALGSFEHQLKVGLDEWRGQLDEALGVDIYGHTGLAVGDYDGDGWEDLYITQPSGLPNRLYRNQGDGTFADVSAAAGVDLLDDSSMALFADVDSDGDEDLLVILPRQPLLLRNQGDGTFQPDLKAGFAEHADRAAMLTGAALADYDQDGDLDLYVCAYDFWQSGATYDAPTPYYDAVNGPPNFLFRNKGDGTFEDATEAAGLMAGNDRYSFAASWADYDSDGDQDLYVANDFGRNNLYRNNGDGTFSDVSTQAGVGDIAAGMSAAWGDYDGDGNLDLYVGNMWSSAGQRVTDQPEFDATTTDPQLKKLFQRHARGNSLFRNKGDGTFEDVSGRYGVNMGRWAWSCDFVDLDNDGRQDIYVQNGYITGAALDDL
ncbi:MAG: VCBS repeat-containing protein [Bryobacterales bacterium]